jgi:cytochrome P450
MPMSNWLSKLLADNISQERSVRYFLFGVRILQLGLYAEDRSMNSRLKQFRAVAKHAIETKLASNDIKGTMLEVIKEKGFLGSEDGYDMPSLIEEFMGFFVAGVDTTSHLLAMSFYYLSIYPEWQQKLREEIQSSSILENLNHKDISQLKVLDIFIKEGFRHYNYIISIFPRKCLKEHKIGEMTIR